MRFSSTVLGLKKEVKTLQVIHGSYPHDVMNLWKKITGCTWELWPHAVPRLTEKK